MNTINSGPNAAERDLKPGPGGLTPAKVRAGLIANGVSEADAVEVFQAMLNNMVMRTGSIGAAGGVLAQKGQCGSCWAFGQ